MNNKMTIVGAVILVAALGAGSFGVTKYLINSQKDAQNADEIWETAEELDDIRTYNKLTNGGTDEIKAEGAEKSETETLAEEDDFALREFESQLYEEDYELLKLAETDRFAGFYVDIDALEKEAEREYAPGFVRVIPDEKLGYRLVLTDFSWNETLAGETFDDCSYYEFTTMSRDGMEEAVVQEGWAGNEVVWDFEAEGEQPVITYTDEYGYNTKYIKNSQKGAECAAAYKSTIDAKKEMFRDYFTQVPNINQRIDMIEGMLDSCVRQDSCVYDALNKGAYEGDFYFTQEGTLVKQTGEVTGYNYDTCEEKTYPIEVWYEEPSGEPEEAVYEWEKPNNQMPAFARVELGDGKSLGFYAYKGVIIQLLLPDGSEMKLDDVYSLYSIYDYFDVDDPVNLHFEGSGFSYLQRIAMKLVERAFNDSRINLIC